MQLLVVYVILVIIGDLAAYGVGIAAERYWESASLVVFLGTYFLVLWVAWLIAVRITRPRTA